MLYSTDVTEAVEHNSIYSQCQLDDAVVEKKFFQDPGVIASEGYAICLDNPFQDELNSHLTGGRYKFQRQVDGTIKLHLVASDPNGFMYYPVAVFNKFFRIVSEQSIDVSKSEVCEQCHRPKKWCECL
jgi:hypothetical protein